MAVSEANSNSGKFALGTFAVRLRADEVMPKQNASQTECLLLAPSRKSRFARWAKRGLIRARPQPAVRTGKTHAKSVPFCSPYAYSLACAFQKLNKQPTDLLWLLLLKPVARSINKVSTAHLRAGGTLHPLERAGNLENTPVALSAYE